ncbi:MAG: helix-turn-helix transcriptional regulator [Syntrophobacteria bacterium]
MARGDQLSRQWRILRMLEESRRGFTVSEVARELNCVRRTVYRYLEILQEAGFPIYTERDGRASRWAFIDTFRFHLPVPFSSVICSQFSKARYSMRIWNPSSARPSLRCPDVNRVAVHRQRVT